LKGSSSLVRLLRLWAWLWCAVAFECR